MFKPLELFVGLRYLRAKRRNHFISFISLTSVLGIALGIIVIITVLSVMNGFQTEVRDRMLRMTAHANVLELDGTLDNWQEASNAISHIDEIVGIAPYVEGQAMMVKSTQVTGVLLSGVDPALETEVSEITNFMLDNDLNVLEAGKFNILIGSELARFLGTRLGGKITVITPEASVTPAGILPKLRRFTVAGIYEVGMNQFDRNTAIIHIEDAKRLYRLNDKVTGLRLKLSDLFLVPELTHKLNQDLQGKLWVTDWTKRHQNFFRAVKMEKTMMFIIMTLIVAVAAFNVVSMLIMVVTDKQSDIAILRTYGVSSRSILWIFIIQGSLIGFVGTVLGVVGGLALALNLEVIVSTVEQLFDLKVLSPSVYYISDLPSEVRSGDVIYVACISFFLTVLATLYPARKAAKTEPAEALRYE
jgi:lipoprotein-releasing system permease protein